MKTLETTRDSARKQARGWAALAFVAVEGICSGPLIAWSKLGEMGPFRFLGLSPLPFELACIGTAAVMSVIAYVIALRLCVRRRT